MDLRVKWLWSAVHKGLEISRGQRGVFIGWHSPYWKKRGW